MTRHTQRIRSARVYCSEVNKMFWIFYYIIQFAPFQQLNAIFRAVPSSRDIARFWESITPATCMPDKCFCEPVQSAIIRQPINTITNLAFIFAGILVVFIAAYDWFANKNMRDNNLMRSHWLYSTIYGFTAVVVGIGSMIYHSTMSFFGQSLDIMGMYMVAIFMMLYNIARFRPMSKKIFLLVYTLITITSFAIATFEPALRRPLFIVMLVAILSSDALVRFSRLPHTDVKFFLASIISLTIGCSAWILDIQNIGCNPTSLIQLHSIWHMGMGGAIFFLYLYYRSETTTISSTTQTITKEEYAC